MNAARSKSPRHHRMSFAALLLLVAWCGSISARGDSTRYFYDDLNRLVRVERHDGIVVSYSYDAVGNRLSKTVIHDQDYDTVPDGIDNCLDVSNPGQENADGDVAGDACDCAPNDATAHAVPLKVAALLLGSDEETISWISAAPSSGPGTVHDVLRGILEELPVGTGSSETCLALGVSGASAIDGTIPAPGQGFWYLVRGRNVCGEGSYGASSSGTPRSSTACTE